MSTPVIFKKSPEDQIVAFFPCEPGTNDVGTCTCYAHVGQHSSADIALCRLWPRAEPADYADLLAELVSIGYGDLKIVHRFAQTYRRARKEAIASIT